ncbi:MAG: hypothetical protein HQ472_09445 [Ignavibacteria bacterium]|nr:hypothetical protein [Ignavibacteria bacterium]
MIRGSSSTISTGGRRRSSGVVFALLVVGFLGLAAGQWQSRQTVRSVEFVGVSGLSSRLLHAQVDTLVGVELRNVSLADVRIAVERIPFIASATVYVTGVSSISIDVTERQPVAMLMTNQGCLCYVDVTGTVLPHTDATNVHDVPVLCCTDGLQLSSAQICTAAKVLEAATNNLDPLLSGTISELRVHAASGRMMITTDKTTWKLGSVSVDRMQQMFADLNVFWSGTGRHLDNRVYSTIDLRWKNHVIVQKAS